MALQKLVLGEIPFVFSSAPANILSHCHCQCSIDQHRRQHCPSHLLPFIENAIALKIKKDQHQRPPHQQHHHIISSTTSLAVPPHHHPPHHQHHQHLGEGNTVHLLVQLVSKDVGCVLNIFDPFYLFLLYSFTCFEYSQCFCCFFCTIFFWIFWPPSTGRCSSAGPQSPLLVSWAIVIIREKWKWSSVYHKFSD